jgi:hypothetical protein
MFILALAQAASARAAVADTLAWAEVADTWAVAVGAAGITWAWVEAGEAAVLAGQAAGGVEVGVAGFTPAL